MLGHKRIETTEKYYIFGTEKDKEQVTEMLEKNLNFAKLYDKEDNIVQKLVLVYNNFLEMRRIMKNYKKYIFDLDYTLLIPDWSKEDDYFKKNIPLEEQEDFFKQKQSILNKYELEFPKYDFKTLSDFFKSYGFSVSEEIINGWMIHNSKTIKDIVADGVVELFEYLKANNKDIVILTS